MKDKLELIKVSLLAVIAICCLILVVHGFSEGGTQDVYVCGGDIDADVSGSVSVDNCVDVNVEGVQGRRIGSHRAYTIDGWDYYAIDVYNQGY